MVTTTIQVDAKLFTAEIACRTAHRYTGSFFVEVRSTDDAVLVGLTARPGAVVPDDLEARFKNDLLDERLRVLVRAETHVLHEDLIRAVVHGALVRDLLP
jgi:His-Xaa-Ser system protein HxsD